MGKQSIQRPLGISVAGNGSNADAADARKAALADAKAQAQVYADAGEVGLGPLLHVEEVEVKIDDGETEVRVRAVWAIEQSNRRAGL